MVDLTLHFHISCVGRDDFAKLNRNASAANLIQISPAFFPDSRRAQLQISKTKYGFF